jgi:hypothetical protein
MTRPRLDSRRRFLQVAGAAAIASVAGCAGGGGGGDGGDEPETEAATEPETETESGDGGQATETDAGGSDGSVPEEYVTAAAQDGTERNPDSVATQEAVMYQSEPKDGQQCTGCAFYIPDKNGDGLGACAVVEGTIEPQAWCSSYVEYEG